MLATFSRINARVAIPLLLLTAAVAFAGYSLASASTPYSVQSGDTLYDIAAKNGVEDSQLDFWVSQVVALNSLSSADALTVGQKLTLPVVISGGGSGTAGGGSSSAAPVSTAGSSYTVKDGDTLYAIASNNGVSDVGTWIDSVLKLNNLGSADLINIGDVIKLPAKASSGSGSASGSSSSGASTATVQYTVQAGDTLYDIAVKNGISESDLSAWLSTVLKLNDLDSPDMLALGAALKVPSKKSSGGSGSSTSSASTIKTTSTTSYTVKSGDTLYDIGMSHGAKDATFSSWVDTVLSLNNLSSPDVLREGDSLKLPDIQGSSATSSGGASISQSTVPTTAPTSFSFSGASDTYTVKSGDTWSGIAAKRSVPSEQIQAWIDNALTLSHMGKDDKLADGVVLLVPANGSITSNSPAPAAASTATVPSTADSTTSSTTTPASKPAKPNKVTSSYTVASGDTLDDIASKYKIGPGQLGSWIQDVLDMNSLASADMLTVGQKLTLPGEGPPAPGTTIVTRTTTVLGQPAGADSTSTSGQSSTPASTSSTPASSGTTTNKPPSVANSVPAPAATSALVKGGNGTCYYTVLSGDTWDSIAAKLGVSNDKKSDWIDGISALNGIKNNTLPVGDAIRLLC